MRLTWRDGVETLLLGFVVAFGMAATRDWGWPLTGSYRSAGLVVFGAGMVMCAMSGSAQSTTSARKSPFITLATALGVLALALLVAVLITGTQGWFVALVVDIAVLWAVTTFRHAVQGQAVPARSASPIGGPAEVR
ncbi:MAG: hypothetical protein WB297_08350 [Actinomycetota bacterium]